MKRLIKFPIVLTVLVAMTFINCFAQQSASVESTMNEIVKKHETSEGVSCMTVAKGSGLDLVKMMFNKQFGKDFMRGVTSITFIEYSEASKEVCLALRKELDAFITLLEEFKVGEEDKFAGNDYTRCFAAVSPDATLSDFVFALEDEETKMLMYMAGKIKVE